MPFLRPTLTALQQQAITDITSANLPNVTGQVLSKSTLAILSYAMAGLAWEHYAYLDWIAQQSVPYSATGEYLEAWGALKGVLRKPATGSTGSVTFTGSDSTLIPDGTLVQRSDGQEYATTGDVTIASGTATVGIAANTTGAATNDTSGITLSLVNAISGINNVGTAATNLTGGADVETDIELRTRILSVFANPPMGGSQSDYVEWALEVSGVTRAWCNPNGMGTGTVVVYTMFDDAESAFSGFPQGTNGVAALETRDSAATGDLLTVANWIYPLRPVTALVYSVAPTPQSINVTIQSLTPNTTAIRAAISTAISNVFVQIGSPLGMTLYQSDIVGAIESVAGVQEFILVSPSSTSIAVGSLPTLGTVSYV